VTILYDFLLVAGGADGGGRTYEDETWYEGGGGGAGKYDYRIDQTLTGVSFEVVVGAHKQSTTFNGITALTGNDGYNGGSPGGGASANGYAGGSSYGSNGGGGGGSGGVGGNATGAHPGYQGIGVANSISGSEVIYAKGGEGGAGRTAPRTNSGDGGYGGWGWGAAGIFIIRYLSAGLVAGTGGTITTSGLYTIHTFTESGTFTPPVPAPGGNKFLMF
jgi:hypothetical protein